MPIGVGAGSGNGSYGIWTTIASGGRSASSVEKYPASAFHAAFTAS
jgi:hypothetical protein